MKKLNLLVKHLCSFKQYVCLEIYIINKTYTSIMDLKIAICNYLHQLFEVSSNNGLIQILPQTEESIDELNEFITKQDIHLITKINVD